MSRHFDDLDAVLEFDALDDFGQLIFALQPSPRFCNGIDQFEDHELGGLRRRYYAPSARRVFAAGLARRPQTKLSCESN